MKVITLTQVRPFGNVKHPWQYQNHAVAELEAAKAVNGVIYENEQLKVSSWAACPVGLPYEIVMGNTTIKMGGAKTIEWFVPGVRFDFECPDGVVRVVEITTVLKSIVAGTSYVTISVVTVEELYTRAGLSPAEMNG